MVSSNTSVVMGAVWSEYPPISKIDCSFDELNKSLVKKEPSSSFRSNRKSSEDIDSYLPEYDNAVVDKRKIDSWYKDLNNHMKKIQVHVSNKRENCLRLYLNKEFHTHEEYETKKSIDCFLRTPSGAQLLGIIDPIGYFIIPLNKIYIEDIDSLFKLSFIKKMTYENKRCKYENAITSTLGMT